MKDMRSIPVSSIIGESHRGVPISNRITRQRFAEFQARSYSVSWDELFSFNGFHDISS